MYLKTQLGFIKKIVVVLFALLVTTCLSTLSAAQTVEKPTAKTIHLAQVRQANPNDCAFKTLTHAYELLGYQLDFPILPPKRGLLESNSGNLDGETARIEGLERNYPNLIRIPVAICEIQYYVYTKQAVEIKSLEQLRTLRFGIRDGVVYLEKLLDDYKPIKVLKNQQLVKLLEIGRLDAIVIAPPVLNRVATAEQKKQLHQAKLYLPPVQLFHYLHKKNHQLIPQVTEALTTLEQSGFIAEAIKNHQP